MVTSQARPFVALLLVCSFGDLASARAASRSSAQSASSGAKFMSGASEGSRELASLLFAGLRNAAKRNLTKSEVHLTKSEVAFGLSKAGSGAVAEDGGSQTPQFTEKTMPAVSPTLRCIMSLLAQYFTVYSLLALSVSINKFKQTDFSRSLEHIIRASASTVTYAPMLSVMFLGTRMRAIQLTQGETEKYGLPQWWVQACMYICTYSLLGQVLLVIGLSAMVGEAVEVSSTGDVDLQKVELPKWPGLIMTTLRYILMAFLYGGLFVILFGVTAMQGPKEIWGKEYPPVSPAVKCTMTLSLTFFGIYLGLAFSTTALEFFPAHGWTRLFRKMVAVFTDARFTVNMSPMLAVLFIGARMRALQIDPKWGNPPWWAQGAFFLCTFSVVFQAFFSTFGPLICECEVKKGECDGDVTFIFKRRTWTGFFAILRYVSLVAIYVGIVIVFASVFFMQHPDGPEMTPPISPAMQCVMFLTTQYFTIFTGLMICVTLNSLLEDAPMIKTLIRIFRAGQETVMFVPMLAVLFIGCRMRALQLTRSVDGTIPTTAGPQPWAQTAMFASTASILVQMVMVMLVSVLMGEHDHHAPTLGKGGARVSLVELPDAEETPTSQRILSVSLEILHYVCLIGMYGGVITIIVAILVMTPETLPPYVYK